MARTDGNPQLEQLYRVLMDRQFDLVPPGEHLTRDVYQMVRHRHPELCDDSYLCSMSCKNGPDSPEWHHVVRAAMKNVRDGGGAVVRGTAHGRWVFGLPARVEPATLVSAVEGRKLLRLHRCRERDAAIVRAKKRSVLADQSRRVCQACDFDFHDVYGQLGRGYVECHHRTPIGVAVGERATGLADLALVCANCHRMLHRRPWRSVEALREIVASRRGLPRA